MRIFNFYVILACVLLACNSGDETKETTIVMDSSQILVQDSMSLHKMVADSASAMAANEVQFEIIVKRNATPEAGNLLKGTLSVNGKDLGTTYENNALKIKSGTYRGFLRYISTKGHVQGTDGYMGDNGDFLLEIGEVTWNDGKKRKNLLFHGGEKAEMSQGCIMLGVVSKDANGNRVLPEGHTLRKLRKEFYGTDNPISSPNKNISIVIN